MTFRRGPHLSRCSQMCIRDDCYGEQHAAKATLIFELFRIMALNEKRKAESQHLGYT